MNTPRKPSSTREDTAPSRRLEAFPAPEREPEAAAAGLDWDRIFDAVGDPIIVFAPATGRILRTNASTRRMFGHTAETFANLRLSALVAEPPPGTDGGLLQQAEQARRLGLPHFEWLAQAADGRRFWAEGTLCPVHGPAAGRAYLTLRDISLRKALEAEHERSGAELRRSEERFRLLLGRMPTVAVQSCGPDGLVRYWNEASERLYGYTAAEALGRPLLGLIVPPLLLAEMRVAYHQMIATGQAIPPAEVRLVRKDGRIVSVFSSHAVLALPGTDTEIYRLDCDLSERNQAEAERLEVERRLLHTQNLESLAVLAGGIAHDFNNLLTGVLGNLELAQMELPGDSPVRPLLDDAIGAARLAGQLTQQILAYAGQTRFQPRQVDLNALVEEQSPLLRDATKGRAVLQLALSAHLPAVEADPAQLAQLLGNLVTNAAESIRGGPGSVEIRTGLEEYCTAERLAQSRLVEKPPPQPFVFLEVADTGCGMDTATALRVLDPFFSTKFTGRGLGLPVVFGIVRTHRGALFIDSGAGRGCIVRVLLPLARAPAPPAPEPVPAPGLRGVLLVVDDEDTVRRIAQRMGQRLGLEVLTALSAEAAVPLCRLHAGTISCTMVDYTMPETNGFDCLHQLREIQHDLPALLCSGCISPELADAAKAAGFDCILQKPFSFDQFAEALRTTLQRTAVRENA